MVSTVSIIFIVMNMILGINIGCGFRSCSKEWHADHRGRNHDLYFCNYFCGVGKSDLEKNDEWALLLKQYLSSW